VGGTCNTHGEDDRLEHILISCNGTFTSVHVSYEGVSKSFWTDRLERELHILKLSATRCSCIAIL
jgi:hypothetical protein